MTHAHRHTKMYRYADAQIQINRHTHTHTHNDTQTYDRTQDTHSLSENESQEHREHHECTPVAREHKGSLGCCRRCASLRLCLAAAAAAVVVGLVEEVHGVGCVCARVDALLLESRHHLRLDVLTEL